MVGSKATSVATYPARRLLLDFSPPLLRLGRSQALRSLGLIQAAILQNDRPRVSPPPLRPPQGTHWLALEWTAPGPFPAAPARGNPSGIASPVGVIVQSPHIRTGVLFEEGEDIEEVLAVANEVRRLRDWICALRACDGTGPF